MITSLRSTKSILSLILLSAISAPTLAAGYAFNFSFGADSGNGYLYTDATGFATSGSMNVIAGTDTGFYNLETAGIVGGGATQWSLTQMFSVDNMVYYGQTPVLDGNGLIFITPDLSNEVNLYSDGVSTYYYWSANDTGYYNDITNNGAAPNALDSFNLTLLPEPASLALLGLGFGLMGLRNRKAA